MGRGCGPQGRRRENRHGQPRFRPAMGPVAHVGRGPPPAQHVVSRSESTHLRAMARRPRPKVVTLTDAAAARISDLMAERGAGLLRVGVKNAGCAGMEYTMSYADAAEPNDERVDDNGVSIVIDGKAVLFLLGSV